MSETAQEIVAQETGGEETEVVLGRLVVQPQFFETLQQMAVFASEDYSRPVLCGILVECLGNEMTMISTDTYRMMVRKFRTNDRYNRGGIMEINFVGSFIVDTTWLKKQLPKIIKEQGGKKEWNRLYRIPLEIVRNNEGHVVLYLGPDRNYEIATINGQYVSWEKIPKPLSDAESVLECGNQMLQGLEWMSGVAELDANRIAICANHERTILKIDYTEVVGQVSAEYAIGGELISGEPFKTGLNCQQLIDFFKQWGIIGVEGPVLHWFGYTMYVGDKGLTIVPKPNCLTIGEDVQYWIMPMLLAGEDSY